MILSERVNVLQTAKNMEIAVRMQLNRATIIAVCLPLLVIVVVITAAWDSETDSCMMGSNTSCSECPEGDMCVRGGCEMNECNGMEYDEYRTCQCTAECEEYGNCCEDVEVCRGPNCGAIMEPCECTGQCGWVDTDGVCAEGRNTNCSECPTISEDCIMGTCEDFMCDQNYVAERTCHCDPSCHDFGNCCEDVEMCVCEDMTDSCDLILTMFSCDQDFPAAMSQGLLTEDAPVDMICCESCTVDACSEIMDPCDCTGECGWADGMCQAGRNTNCSECPVISEDCVPGSCRDFECDMEYNEYRTCHCDPSCRDFGNCCHDAEMCYEDMDFMPVGPGICQNDMGGSPPNYSMNGHTKESCRDACRDMKDHCIGLSVSRGGRCALWMDVETLGDREHPEFGMGHKGANWRVGGCLTHTNGDEAWMCEASTMCGRESESRESESEEFDLECHEAVFALGALSQAYEEVKEDAEFVHKMFEQCLMGELTEDMECNDIMEWRDSMDRSCAYYDMVDLCDYDYLHILLTTIWMHMMLVVRAVGEKRRVVN
eukprot:UN22992